MISSLYEVARYSPFKGPLTVARCEDGVPSAGGDSCELGSTKYFLLCGLGGLLACGKYLNRLNDTNNIKQNSCILCKTVELFFHLISRSYTHSPYTIGFGEMSFASRSGEV